MKLIFLTLGKFVLVDDHWYDYLMQWNWYTHKDKNNYYAVRNIRFNGKRSKLFMHQVIMNTPDGKEVDHQDHNGLNCLEENMRNATHSQNQMNKRNNGKSKYHGVSYDGRGRVRAAICKNDKRILIGYFPTEEIAAHAYDEKAKELFGEYANLNFK